MEPETEKDKADFILYLDGKAVPFVHRKSGIRLFEKTSVKGWMEALYTDVPEGMHELIRQFQVFRLKLVFPGASLFRKGLFQAEECRGCHPGTL